MKYFGSLLLAFALFLVACAEQGAGDAASDPSQPAEILRSTNRVSPTPAIAPDNVETASNTHAVLSRYCIDCHGADKQQGKVRFDTLASLDPAERSDLLGRAREAIHFEEMPPDDKPQPKSDEVKQLLAWMQSQLDPQADANLNDKLRYPHYGNLVDHDLLFSGDVKDKPYTPARRWRVSPQIFHERVMDVFALEGRDRESFKVRQFYGVTNPFVLPDQSGVRDYDITSLSGGHLLVMLNNAQWIAGKQIYAARLKRPDKDQLPALSSQDRWYPRTTPAEFESIVLQDTSPTQQQITGAIQLQFQRALGRQAKPEEIAKYLHLTQHSIELAGNVEGLRQMLIAVLLESEFLYRVEFGAGQVDALGRRKLAPQEAAYAISYALGDRKPDASLIKAAQEGRLLTKQDYKREVERLLTDEQYFRGPIDPSLNGKHYKSNETSHPRKVRFFREFFGYTAAAKVFKDRPRSGGIYQNPGRGTQGTPGRLILETDRIVTRYVEQDQEVFKNLLTSDQFFVYHDKDDETGQQILSEWKRVYEKLKETDWKTDPHRVLTENLDFLKTIKSMRIKDASRPGELVNYMHYFEESFGQGRNPYTTVPWAHGYYLHHAPLYSLPPTPGTGRYGSWKSIKYLGEKNAAKVFWDYPTRQPFKIPNRKGILTHPSWLIAHSTNFHSDPIKRGRWIREKLLAGRVPDVPITVDAQVPDDPHKTFRDRVVEVTSADECWKCHKQMNPLGLPFESYDDFGRFRTEEVLEHPENLIKRGNGKTTFDTYPTLPIDSTGALKGTGDSGLDGEVADAFELIDRLAQSDRVRQSIIRHAFRFYMGRNEMPSDSQTLIDADHAYLDSGGSFNAVIVSLLTSDSFMYRKEIKE